MALDAVAELGARNVLIGHGAGAFALFREDRRAQRFEVSIPRHEPLAPAGAGDSMLAGYLAARVGEQSLEEALGRAVATGAAATLAVGAGRFDARDVSRLAQDVTVRAVEPVATR
jgi:1-phosphofructokinase